MKTHFWSKRARALIIASVLLCIFSCAALALFPRYSIYRKHFLLTVAIAIPACCCVAVPRFTCIPEFIGRAIMRPSAHTFNLFVFLAGTFFFSTLSLLLFEGTPVLDDDVSALFQARIFLSGHLTVPAPQPPDFFKQYAVISGYHNVDRLCTMYPCGHPLVLLPGLALGIPWIIMPLFSAGTCVLTAVVGRQLFSERIARLAALTCLTSPMFAELGSTFLNHAPTAFGILLAIWGVLSCLDVRHEGTKGRWWHGALAGLGISLAFLCRPLDAFVSGIVIGLLVLAHPLKAWRSKCPFLIAALVLGVAVLVHCAWTQVQTGDWRIPGHVFCLRGLGKYGFTSFFGPKKACYHAALRTMEFGAKATGWPIAVFFPAFLPFFRRGLRGKALFFWLFFLALSTVYFFFFGYEHCFPARYLFGSLPVMILLASTGWTILAEEWGIPLCRMVFVPMLMGVFIFLPMHLCSFDDHWQDMDRHLSKVIQKARIHHAVVIQSEHGIAKGRVDKDKKFYAAAFLQNALDFNGDIIYVRNLRSRNAELPHLFPGREIYLYRFRRDINMSELYREDFDPKTGRPSHTFMFIDAPHYVNPDNVELSIPDASFEKVSLDKTPAK